MYDKAFQQLLALFNDRVQEMQTHIDDLKRDLEYMGDNNRALSSTISDLRQTCDNMRNDRDYYQRLHQEAERRISDMKASTYGPPVVAFETYMKEHGLQMFNRTDKHPLGGSWRVEVIKEVRMRTGWRLKESKDAVESYPGVNLSFKAA